MVVAISKKAKQLLGQVSTTPAQAEKQKKRKTTQAAKKLLTSIKEKGHLGRKAPSPEKEKAQAALTWLNEMVLV